MAKSWHFPVWRNLLMQAVMWVVLGGGVVLAAMLDRHLRQAQSLDLSPVIVDGPLSFRFPAGWDSTVRKDTGESTAHFATDSNEGIDRTFVVSRQRVSHLMPPAQYMLRLMPLEGQLSESAFTGVMIDGWPGQTIAWSGHRISMGASNVPQFSKCSAVVLPDNQAIIIRMDKNAPFEQADERLYRQILDQTSIATTRPSDGGTVHLTDNISVDVPSDLNLYPQPDALRRDREAAAITDSGGWISAQFIPIAGVPFPAVIRGPLAAREQLDFRETNIAYRWTTAEISQQGPNHWIIDPQDSINEVVHRTAHLLTGDGGDAVVVVLTAETPAGFVDLDHLWDELSSRIQIGKSPALTRSLEAGLALTKSLRSAVAGESWWLWSRGSTPVGFTRGLTERDLKSAATYTVRRNWNGTVTAVDQQWALATDAGPVSKMTRLDADTNSNDAFIPLFSETTLLSDPITTVVRLRNGREDPPTRMKLSPFVSSQWLPGQLVSVGKSPTAFWTDRFPGVEAELFPTPLLVVAHRVEDVGSYSCIEAEVNGTGDASRWYFRSDGSLDHADFAGDLHLRSSNEGEIESAFAADHRLTTQPH